MGKLTVTLDVGDQQGSRFRSLELGTYRETGSTLPRALLEDLAVPVARRANSRMPIDRTVTVEVGWSMLRLEGRIFPTRVIFAGDGESSLPGMVALEEALPAVNPVAQRLIPVDADRL